MFKVNNNRRRRSGIFIVNFEHISLCSIVSIVNFEHVIAGWGILVWFYCWFQIEQVLTVVMLHKFKERYTKKNKSTTAVNFWYLRVKNKE